MKKFLTLLLVFVLVFSFCSCTKNEPEDTVSTESEETVDVEYYLSAGRIPEADFALGTHPDAVIGGLKEKGLTQNDDFYDENSFSVIEGNISYRITNGAVTYYYNKNKADSGISAIVCFDTSYGLNAGITTISEVKETVNIKDCETSVANDSDLFFTEISMGEVKVLFYKNGNNILKFYFTDDILFAVTLENNNWSL